MRPKNLTNTPPPVPPVGPLPVPLPVLPHAP